MPFKNQKSILNYSKTKDKKNTSMKPLKYSRFESLKTFLEEKFYKMLILFKK